VRPAVSTPVSAAAILTRAALAARSRPETMTLARAAATMQRTHGNRAVQRLARTATPSLLQRSITLAEPDDVSGISRAVAKVKRTVVLQDWLDHACPDGRWKVDAATGSVDCPQRATFCAAHPAKATPSVHHTTSRHPESCGCFCELTAPGAVDVELQIHKPQLLGAFGETYFPVPDDPFDPHPEVERFSKFSDPRKRRVIASPFDGAWKSAGATSAGRSSGTGRNQYPSMPAWVTFMHEVCGHARKQTKKDTPEDSSHATSLQGNRSAADVENRARREHSTVTDSLGVRVSWFKALARDGSTQGHDGALYRIGKKESLRSVAARCGIPVADAHNHIWTSEGQRLDVEPDVLPVEALLQPGTELLVEGIDWYDPIAGETAESIAKTWNVPVASLQRANPDLQRPAARVSRRLLIPGS
jgi:hypothetical protein